MLHSFLKDRAKGTLYLPVILSEAKDLFSTRRQLLSEHHHQEKGDPSLRSAPFRMTISKEELKTMRHWAGRPCQITGLVAGRKEQERPPTGWFKDSTWYQFFLGHHIVIRRFDRFKSARAPTSGIRPDV